MDGLSGEVEMLWSSSKKRWKSKSSISGDCIIYPLDWVGYVPGNISNNDRVGGLEKPVT